MRIVLDAMKLRRAMKRRKLTTPAFGKLIGDSPSWQSVVMRWIKLPKSGDPADYPSGIPLSTLAHIVTALGLRSENQVLSWIPDREGEVVPPGRAPLPIEQTAAA